MRSKFLAKLGIEDTEAGKEKLLTFISDAIDKGTTVSERNTEFGREVSKQIEVVVDNTKQKVNVNLLYRKGESVPEVTTISPPEVNKEIAEEVTRIKSKKTGNK